MNNFKTGLTCYLKHTAFISDSNERGAIIKLE
jgi:hypothetical protein